MDIKGVVDVRETLTGRRNLHVEIVGTSTSDVTRLTDSIHELGLEIDSSEIMKQHQRKPFNHFQYEGELVDEDVDENTDE